jgi:hypothetical protein
VISFLGNVTVLVMSAVFPVFLSRTLCVIAVRATTFRLDRVTARCACHVAPPAPPSHIHRRPDSVDLIARTASKICHVEKHCNCFYTHDEYLTPVQRCVGPPLKSLSRNSPPLRNPHVHCHVNKSITLDTTLS